MSATIRINGEERPFAPATLAEILAANGIDAATRGVAIALNGAVAPRAAWTTTRLAPGDAVEIVRPYRGG